jgi:membrane associated rhomboid family serine protease
MFIPLRTDRPPRHKPVVTQMIIAANVLVYIGMHVVQVSGEADMENVVDRFSFNPHEFRAWQLLTYQFMHDPNSIWHLVFNMLFLWVFGSSVEDRISGAGFAVFYLVGGAAAALGHMLVSKNPVIGASGSVAACTGAFLALYPRSRILMFYIIGGAMFYVSSLWFIGLYFIVDLLNQGLGFMGFDGGVAYAAHLAGYIYGFGVGFVLLATKILPREEYDVFFLFTQARRRAAMRAANRAARSATGPWESATADTGERLAKRAAEPLSPQAKREMELRAQVQRLAESQDLHAAGKIYAGILDEFPQSMFNQDRQLELANQLFADHDPQHAAMAYELLLDRFPSVRNVIEVQLILAVLYTRHLHQPDKARRWIDAAKPKIRDSGQTTLINALIAELPVSSPS